MRGWSEAGKMFFFPKDVKEFFLGVVGGQRLGKTFSSFSCGIIFLHNFELLHLMPVQKHGILFANQLLR